MASVCLPELRVLPSRLLLTALHLLTRLVQDFKSETTGCSEVICCWLSFQVVVLKVSLHCKACAGKVKKHLSKMEGEHQHRQQAIKISKTFVCEFRNERCS